MKWILTECGRVVPNYYTGKPRLFQSMNTAQEYARLSQFKRFTVKKETDNAQASRQED